MDRLQTLAQGAGGGAPMTAPMESETVRRWRRQLATFERLGLQGTPEYRMLAAAVRRAGALVTRAPGPCGSGAGAIPAPTTKGTT